MLGARPLSSVGAVTWGGMAWCGMFQRRLFGLSLGMLFLGEICLR